MRLGIRRPAALSAVRGAVFVRGYTGDFSKNTVEVRRVVVAARRRDGEDGVVRPREQFARPLNAADIDVISRRHVVGGAERFGEAETRLIHGAGDRVERDVARVVRIDIGERSLQIVHGIGFRQGGAG